MKDFKIVLLSFVFSFFVFSNTYSKDNTTLKCFSCDIKVTDSKETLSLIGNWLFSRSNEPGIENSVIDYSNWIKKDNGHLQKKYFFELEQLEMSISQNPDSEELKNQYNNLLIQTALNLNINDWQLVSTPGSWKKAYNSDINLLNKAIELAPDNQILQTKLEDYNSKKKYRTGWYKAKFSFTKDFIGKEVVLLIDTYMAPTNFFVDGKSVYNRDLKTNSYKRYYGAQPMPIKFKVTKLEHNVSIKIDTILMTGIYQRPFELRPHQLQDNTISFYHFWAGELRLITTYVLLFFGFFFMLVYYKTKSRFYMEAAFSGILVMPFFLFPTDVMTKLFNPEKLLVLHYTGIAALAWTHLVFAQNFYKKMKVFVRVTGTIQGICALVMCYLAYDFNIHIFTPVRLVLFLSAYLTGGAIIYCAFKGWRKGIWGAEKIIIFESIFFLAATNDFLNAFGVLQGFGMLSTGVLVSAAGIILIASEKFANTFVENIELNANLEAKVLEKTAQLREKNKDINAMLQNMPQGVLTIVEGNKIHKEYSAYVETIYETEKVADEDAINFFFDSTDLGADKVSQVKTSLSNFIGEDILNYEINEDLLVNECKKSLKNGHDKHVEFIWSPICSDDDIVEKIMVCVRDVTHLKELESESAAQKEQLDIISQLILVSETDFKEFYDSAKDYLKENREVMQDKSKVPEEKSASLDPEVMQLLFRNMHTIKGNARTHNFVLVSDAAHDIEHEYDMIRNQEQEEFSIEKMLGKLDVLEQALDRYVDISVNILGRKDTTEGEGEEKSTILQSELKEILSKVKDLNVDDKGLVRSTMDSIVSKLVSVTSHKMENILGGITKSLTLMAEDLGKEVPFVKIHDPGFYFDDDQMKMLKDVFTHVIRNSLDHGIETVKERHSKNKPSMGTIDVELVHDGGSICIKVKDDGAGLNLKRIYDKAASLNIVDTSKTYTAKDIGDLVFSSGLSTAEKVTDISGRGVGMDAVRAFLEKHGGSIYLEFDDESSLNYDSEAAHFTWVIKIPEEQIQKAA